MNKNFLLERKELCRKVAATKIRLGNPPGAWLEVNGLVLNDWNDIPNPFNIIIKKDENGL